jgi:hypothetical protein
VKDGFSKTSSAGGDIYTKKIPVSGTPTAPTNAINHCQNDAIKSVNKTVDYQRLMQTPNTSGNTNSIADLARSADAWLARFSTGNSQPDGYNLTTTGEGGTGSGTKATKNPNPQTFNIDVLLDIYNYKHFGTGLDPKRSFDLVDVVTDAIQEVPNSNSVIIQAFKESDLLHKKPETREVMEFNTHFGKMRSVRGIKAGTPYDSIYPGYLKGMTFEEYLNHPKRKTVIGKY